MTNPVLRIADADKARLRVMFLAKHALSGGIPHPEDGTHAVYHHEMLTTLRDIGLDVTPANSFRDIHEKPDTDYVVSLLNRGGFVNSEMMGPLLLTQHKIAFMGASPILRGLSDDKHLMKMAAQYRGVPVTPWLTVRRGQGAVPTPDFAWERLVVKPNASSASWGVKVTGDWDEGKAHAEHILQSGHDVIIEPYAPLIDVAVPVVGGNGPWILPVTGYFPDEPGIVRSYQEKRGLVETCDDPLEQLDDRALVERLEGHTRALMAELWPFDYGRFEYRYDPATGDVRFMEVNLSCNLWSKKTISRAARSIGVGHADLVETIIAHSMLRQGVIGHALDGEGREVRLAPELQRQVALA